MCVSIGCVSLCGAVGYSVLDGVYQMPLTSVCPKIENIEPYPSIRSPLSYV